MEFAITVPALRPDLMTPDGQAASGVFCFFVELEPEYRTRGMGEHLRIVLIALFGAAGTLARYCLQGVIQGRGAGTFPWGTLIVNLTGCFFLGLIAQFTMNRLTISPDLRVAIAVGFFGGYTTFSSFGWETAKMMEEGEWLRASAYVGASVIAGLLLSVAGIRLANKF